MRNPLFDPAPGDIVRAKDGRERRVDETWTWNNNRGPRVMWTGFGWTGSGPGWQSSVTAWRAWCRLNQAKVVKVGNAGD